MTDTVGWMNDRLVVMLAEAKKEERERIIKLLEVWWETDQELEELIDIIKGESK